MGGHPSNNKCALGEKHRSELMCFPPSLDLPSQDYEGMEQDIDKDPLGEAESDSDGSGCSFDMGKILAVVQKIQHDTEKTKKKQNLPLMNPKDSLPK